MPSYTLAETALLSDAQHSAGGCAPTPRTEDEWTILWKQRLQQAAADEKKAREACEEFGRARVAQEKAARKEERRKRKEERRKRKEEKRKRQ